MLYTPMPIIETIEEKIERVFKEDARIAIAVAKAESQLKTEAYNPEWHRGCQGSYSVFQIACIHHIENPNALFDEDFNIEKAYAIYKEQGWQPWSAYTNGSYKQYLI